MPDKIFKLIPTEITFGEDELRYKWNTLDDQLTGGKSSSRIKQSETFIRYSGTIRSINKSSWSCLRSNRIDQDLSKYKAVKLKINSDGRPYAFQIEFNEGWHDEKLSCVFQSLPNQWTTVHLKFEDFQHIKFTEKSTKILNHSVLNHVLRYNILVAENITGPFKLEIESITFC